MFKLEVNEVIDSSFKYYSKEYILKCQVTSILFDSVDEEDSESENINRNEKTIINKNNVSLKRSEYSSREIASIISQPKRTVNTTPSSTNTSESDLITSTQPNDFNLSSTSTYASNKSDESLKIVKLFF